MKKLVWMSYDLGIRGDYESLYKWLDEHDAKECGDNLACFDYHYREDPIGEMKQELQGRINTTKDTRIYVILLDGGKIRGKFLFGNRRSSPWVGYAGAETESDEYSDEYEEE